MQCKRMSVAACGAVALLCISGTAMAGGPFPGPQPIGPDITLCQVYGLSSFGRVGTYPNGTSGLALATTSWNIGTVNAKWEQSPDSDHPPIGMDLFRLRSYIENGVSLQRFEQIGQSWLKHGFFALSNEQCGAHPWAGQNGVPAWTGQCQGTNGTSLGVGCTDTYSSGLNAQQSNLGPRFEVNPWTGMWHYDNSMFELGGPSNTGIRRRLQVRDQDLIPPQGQGYSLFAQAYYVAADDVDVMNSAGWKSVGTYQWTGSAWTFNLSAETVDEVSGFAYDAWGGARKTMVAQQLPIVEHWTATNQGIQASPDGRAVILSKVFNLNNGKYRYEFAVFNIDMDRQIQSFKVPVSEQVNVTNVGFSIVLNHDEPNTYSFLTGPNQRFIGPPVNNAPWTNTRTSNAVEWATTPHPAGNPPYGSGTAANPIRWGTMANFWFDADQPPTDGLVDLGMYKPGPVNSVSGVTNVPTPVQAPVCCLGDADASGSVSFSDVTSVLANLGNTYAPGNNEPGDSDCSGAVNFTDITEVLANLGLSCN